MSQGKTPIPMSPLFVKTPPPSPSPPVESPGEIERAELRVKSTAAAAEAAKAEYLDSMDSDTKRRDKKLFEAYEAKKKVAANAQAVLEELRAKSSARTVVRGSSATPSTKLANQIFAEEVPKEVRVRFESRNGSDMFE